MWEYEIERLLDVNDTFIGCYPHDKLPQIEKKSNISIIINTANSKSVGEHWVAMRMTKDKCFYFDSFGLPIVEEYLLKFLHPHYNVVTYSDVCIQHLKSDKCGEFCILFVKHVKNKTTYDKFLSNFNYENLQENDAIVEQWMGKGIKREV